MRDRDHRCFAYEVNLMESKQGGEALSESRLPS